MTVVCREAYRTRETSTQGGANNGSRSFYVYDDGAGTPLTSSLAVRLLFGTGSPDPLPQYGEQFPGAASPFVAYDVRIVSLEGANDVWQVDWQYRDAPVGGVINTLQPQDVGFIEFSCTGQAVFEDQWRSLTSAQLSALVASGGSYPNGVVSSEVDIGGTSIDSGGYPVSGPLRKTVKLSVTETRDGFPDMGYLMSFVGRRNNVPFAGAAVGLVVYVSPQVSRIGPYKYRYTHEFVLDNQYHMVQAAFRQPDGSVQIGTSGGTSGKAQYVYYRQPFPNFANLYAISPYFAGVF